MKSDHQKLPINLFVAVLAILSFLMLATRTHHFSSFNHLPSASIAIFFLAGMYLRNIKAFWFFYILTLTIDLASSYYRGQFGDCITTSYPALVLSYGVMFTVGYYTRPNWQRSAWQINIVKVALALFIASSIAFFISNGSYYALSGKFPELSWAEYATRVDKYYFKSISNPIFYVISAIVIDFTLSHFFADKAIDTKVNNSL
ncbi:hypothetical protein FGD67_15090 [Colwellia sp. M166]|uniref:hypothetical protein n=1 Tax=Colwellia sp. M166 TaxID=2583805 RepID=UPI00211DDB68|nr:hypothetical protein [Colwellia sp. M166]UUO24400.1 hypothetical protein FGD67_15090 [Colwellia sp. M166]|tara:strand:+ start:725 stop:1330 length:606 start_codon:yes stop_codon:yes gene_type:complete